MANIEKTRVRASRIRHALRNKAVEGKARLSCHKSNEHIYAQIIDDVKGVTVVSASTLDKKLAKDIKKGGSMEAAQKVGDELAKRAAKAGVKDVYFDRGGNRYAGRVKALADAARAGGLNF